MREDRTTVNIVFSDIALSNHHKNYRQGLPQLDRLGNIYYIYVIEGRGPCAAAAILRHCGCGIINPWMIYECTEGCRDGEKG